MFFFLSNNKTRVCLDVMVLANTSSYHIISNGGCRKTQAETDQSSSVQSITENLSVLQGHPISEKLLHFLSHYQHDQGNCQFSWVTIREMVCSPGSLSEKLSVLLGHYKRNCQFSWVNIREIINSPGSLSDKLSILLGHTYYQINYQFSWNTIR